MRQLILFGLLASVALLVSGEVIELHDSDFDSRVAEYEIALVKFYAPWCGHCKRLAPEFDKAAATLRNDDPPIALIKVDCTVESKTCGKFSVSGYPTLKIFKRGEFAMEYGGAREADAIVSYMRLKAGPVSKELKTVEEAEKFLSNFGHSVVGFFKSADSDLAKEFAKTADTLAEKFRFAYTTNADLLAKYKHEDEIVIYQPPRLQIKLEPTEKVYSGAAQSNKIKQFIFDEAHGLVGHRTQSNDDQFKRPLVVVTYALDYIKDVKGSNYVRNRVVKVAQKLNGEGVDVRFAVASYEEFRHELQEYGYTDFKPDGRYVMGKGRNNEKFRFDGEYS